MRLSKYYARLLVCVRVRARVALRERLWSRCAGLLSARARLSLNKHYYSTDVYMCKMIGCSNAF